MVSSDEDEREEKNGNLSRRVTPRALRFIGNYWNERIRHHSVVTCACAFLAHAYARIYLLKHSLFFACDAQRESSHHSRLQEMDESDPLTQRKVFARVCLHTRNPFLSECLCGFFRTSRRTRRRRRRRQRNCNIRFDCGVSVPVFGVCVLTWMYV